LTTANDQTDTSDNQKGRKKWWQTFLRLIGLGLFIWILTSVDIRTTFSALSNADLGLVASGVMMAIPVVSIRSWRLHLILRSLGVEISLPKAFLIRLVGTAAGDMLPGRTGELITVAYLQQAGHGVRDPFLTLILDRLFDFVILVLCAVAGFSLVGEKLTEQVTTFQAFLIFAALGLCILIAGLLYLRSRPGMISRLVKAFLPSRWHEKFRSLTGGASTTHTAGQVFQWDYALLLKIAGASVLAFFFLVLRGFFMARSIGIDFSLPFLAVCMAITTLLQLIPISNVLGVGTREVSLVYLFGLAGVPAELAVGFSFLIVLGLLIQDLVGLFLWLRYPVGTRF
jgi:uncharacterized protein (TIRG00374 family)